MSTKTIWWIAALVALAIGVGLALRQRGDDPVAEKPPPAEESFPASIAEAPIPATILPSHPMAVAFGSGVTAPEQEPAVLVELLQAYRRVAGSFPTAEDNAHLMNKLRGEGPVGVRLFPAEHARYDADGALLDAWGTPFFFHHVGAQRIEVRSAGPDRTFYSADDVQADSSM